jgi:hypothetical protein
MASEAKMESTEPKKPHAKQLEQPGKGGGGVSRTSMGLLWRSPGFCTGAAKAVEAVQGIGRYCRSSLRSGRVESILNKELLAMLYSRKLIQAL